MMADKERHCMGTGREIRTHSSISAQQIVVAWAAMLLGAVFMATGGVVMILSLS